VREEQGVRSFLQESLLNKEGEEHGGRDRPLHQGGGGGGVGGGGVVWGSGWGKKGWATLEGKKHKG